MQAFLAPRKPRAGTVIGTTYRIPLTSISAEEFEDEKKRLTLQARASFGAPPPAFCAWSIDAGGCLCVPRFYGLERFGSAETDERTLGAPVDFTFAGSLTPVQRRVDASLDPRFAPSSDGNGGSIVVLPCGYGKTVFGVHFFCKMKRKACVIVHKGIIRDQWKQTFERFCPGIRVGVVQGSKWELGDEYDVVIAMVMTVARHADESPERFDAFGLVIADEAHHYAAPVMNQAMRLFRARYVLGLTATKDRPDGLTTLLHWCMGPEGFRVERDNEHVRVSVALFEGGAREVLTRDGKPLVSVMVNHLAANARRNAFISERIVSFRTQGRVMLVLSDRIAQLHALRDLVLASGRVDPGDVGLFVGSTKEAVRGVELAKPIVFCSYSMANEGVDKREADTCIMATPKARITQCVGRIQRPCATKQTPLVLDIADDAGFFVQLRWKRLSQYRKDKYDVRLLSAATARDEEWYD